MHHNAFPCRVNYICFAHLTAFINQGWKEKAKPLMIFYHPLLIISKKLRAIQKCLQYNYLLA